MMRVGQLAPVGAFEEFLQRHQLDLDLLRDLVPRRRDEPGAKGQDGMAGVRLVGRARAKAAHLAPVVGVEAGFLAKFPPRRVERAGVITLIQSTAGKLQDDPSDAMAVSSSFMLRFARRFRYAGTPPVPTIA